MLVFCIVVDCSFEDTCTSWSNTKNGDVFDWVVANSITGTINTGPSNDHTLNSKLGRF